MPCGLEVANGVKSLGSMASGMPGPLSFTEMRASGRVRPLAVRTRWVATAVSSSELRVGPTHQRVEGVADEVEDHLRQLLVVAA